MEQRTQRFIDALGQLEASRDAGPIAALCAEGADVSNPMVKHDSEGKGGAHAFWSRYRASFETISSSFKTIVDGQDVALLEWVSKGRMKGEEVRYGGVSVLEFGEGGITAFRTYFNPTPLAAALSPAT